MGYFIISLVQHGYLFPFTMHFCHLKYHHTRLVWNIFASLLNFRPAKNSCWIFYRVKEKCFALNLVFLPTCSRILILDDFLKSFIHISGVFFVSTKWFSNFLLVSTKCVYKYFSGSMKLQLTPVTPTATMKVCMCPCLSVIIVII